MSSRLLKKLHGESNLEINESEEIVSDIESEKEKKQLNTNRYDLLNEQSLSESEVKEDDNETEHTSTATPHPIEAKKKKKKRKKKSGKQHATNRRSSEDNADIDEISRTVREVENLYGQTATVQPKETQKSTGLHTILKIHHKNLNPSHEMKRMFGSKVVQAEQNKRRNARGPRPLKSTWLVTPRDNSPSISELGLSMAVDTNPLNNSSWTWFKFEHNSSYRAIQNKFLKAIEKMDTGTIIQIVNQQPYHIDSLLQLSDLCKVYEDHEMASTLIEHAILAYELSFNSMFNLTTAECRIDYKRQENRGFFIALFKHSQYLEARACPRTALEVAKLVLSFDPICDPLAMILVVDYYAMRAKQYSWLIKLFDEWQDVKMLGQLPNMAYSYALSLFFESGGDTSKADIAIQYALMMFPGVLKLLLDEISAKFESSFNYFDANAYTSQPPALQQLVSLYVHRSKSIWRDKLILSWLERNTCEINAVVEAAGAKDGIVAEYAAKRHKKYNKNPPKEILRHIILSDYKEKVPLAQFINKDAEPILRFDPLPPIDTINIYTRPNMPARVLENRSPFSMFFRSMLPNFNIQDYAAADQDGGNDLAANNAMDLFDLNAIPEAAAPSQAPSFTDLTASINSVLAAMRNFMSRVPEPPNDADVDESESSDDLPDEYLT